LAGTDGGGKAITAPGPGQKSMGADRAVDLERSMDSHPHWL